VFDHDRPDAALEKPLLFGNALIGGAAVHGPHAKSLEG
jgi:hypothetical protein